MGHNAGLQKRKHHMSTPKYQSAGLVEVGKDR